MTAFLQLIRLQNIFIILVSQGLIFFGLFKPAIRINAVSGPDTGMDFILFFGFTALIAASGYIINDLIDVPVDAINKPKKRIVGQVISVKRAKIYYVLTLIAGLLLSVVLAIKHHQIAYIPIYLVLCAGLAFYSCSLKQRPVSGNMLVALLSALVPAIFIFFFYEPLKQLAEVNHETHHLILTLVFAYSIFAFLSGFCREIIKDMEDLEGDRQHRIRSTAVALGIKKSKVIALVTGVALSGTLCAWIFFPFNLNSPVLVVYIVLLMALLAKIIQLLYRAESKADFSGLSKLLKYFMLAGLIYLLIFSIIYF